MQVVKLADLPEDVRKAYEDYVSNAGFPEPAAEYDDNGLKFSIDHLTEVGGSLCLMPLEFSARYVDAVTKTNIDNGSGLLYTFPTKGLQTPETYNQINATSIGNYAYIVLNCQDKEIVAACFEFLEAYQQWYLKTAIIP